VKKKSQRGGARAGAGRPASGRVGVMLRLSQATVDRLDKLAPERIAQARVIDALIESATDEHLSALADSRPLR